MDPSMSPKPPQHLAVRAARSSEILLPVSRKVTCTCCVSVTTAVIVTVPPLGMASRVTPLPDGSTQLAIQLDLSQAAVPERSYTADAAGVVFDGVRVKILFAQRRLDGTGLRSLIVLPMSTDSVRQLMGTTKTFLPQVGAFMDRNGMKPADLLGVDREPDQTVALPANMATISYAGRDATIDFYHASAGSIHALKKSDGLAIEAVVRVDMPTGVLVSLVAKLTEICQTLPEEVL